MDSPKNTFTRVPHWILEECGHPSSIAVWVALGTWENRSTHACWPSMKNIASLAKMSIRSVHNALEDLKKIGALETFRRKSANGMWLPNGYILHYEGMQILPRGSAKNDTQGRQNPPYGKICRQTITTKNYKPEEENQKNLENTIFQKNSNGTGFFDPECPDCKYEKNIEKVLPDHSRHPLPF